MHCACISYVYLCNSYCVYPSENYGLAVKSNKMFFVIKSKYVDMGKNSGAVLNVPT